MPRNIGRCLLVLLFPSLVACDAGDSTQPSAKALDPAVADRPAFDLEVTMMKIVETLERRMELIRIALDDSEDFGRPEADRYIENYCEEFGLVRSIKLQMEAHPTLSPRICEWYESVLRAPNEELNRLTRKAFGRDSDIFEWNDVIRIFGEEYASRPVEERTTVRYELLRRSINRFDAEHPNSRFKDFMFQGDIHVFCVKMRMIEGSSPGRAGARGPG